MSTSATRIAGPPAILTFTGRRVSLLDGVPSLIDIAVALSRQPRFAGHGRAWYSVLDHLLFCEGIVASYSLESIWRDDRRLALLLHDAHEAMTGDIPTPFKQPANRGDQALLDIRIADAYFPGGFEAYSAHKEYIKAVDHMALLVEAIEVGPAALQTPADVEAWVGEAPSEFLRTVFRDGRYESDPRELRFGPLSEAVLRYIARVRDLTDRIKSADAA